MSSRSVVAMVSDVVKVCGSHSVGSGGCRGSREDQTNERHQAHTCEEGNDFFSVNFFFLIPFLPIGPVMFKDPELKKSFPALKLDEVRLISSVCFAYCPEFILTGSFS